MTTRRRPRIAGQRRQQQRRNEPRSVRLRRWWRGFRAHHKYTWPIEIALAVLLGGILAAVQLGIDGQRSERQEILANVQFIRETVRDDPDGVKNFRGMNLRNADLSGLDLGCDVKIGHGLEDRFGRLSVVNPVDESRCADLTGADLTGARLDGTDLTGAWMEDVTFSQVQGVDVKAAGIHLTVREMQDVELSVFDLRGAHIDVSKIGPKIDLKATLGDLSALEVLAPGRIEFRDTSGPYTAIHTAETICYDWRQNKRIAFVSGTYSCGVPTGPTESKHTSRLKDLISYLDEHG